ncbi:hypothetical protein BCR41DRAFT_372414 [Lobosporangium transversale]|uniref:Crinkler effector protein N-terminal domain-containing protein n=1 Tax=Lobosporangium transversale TaxID=64571 RepID=A0A1Y2GIH7_9FUNG|nr:hypothetical protein BCR41DRAFT_372414 [Lobosporangium transversale]ORZ10673.1 hypothetical protein BCR41DRAFT_372414 [Lobosporangium transversale]|eukprot:XP_021879394.1 hypothetical protein BCR41DRAFT_372414 [Lobosporangium transversale]
MATKLKLFCIVEGELTSFSVTILSNETIDDLKKVIKAEKAPDLNYIASNKLTLELIPGGATKEGLLSFPKGSVKVLDELEKLSTYFPEGAAEGLIHIIVKVPQQAEQPQLYPCRPKVAVSLAQRK